MLSIVTDADNNRNNSRHKGQTTLNLAEIDFVHGNLKGQIVITEDKQSYALQKKKHYDVAYQVK